MPTSVDSVDIDGALEGSGVLTSLSVLAMLGAGVLSSLAIVGDSVLTMPILGAGVIT